jgi:hypothetical protein
MKVMIAPIAAVLLLTAAIFNPVQAQKDEDYEDLRKLYMDEKYEKLISKGEKYLGDSDTRKEPEPYMFLSKAYYEISRMEDMHEDFPPDKAFANSLKWATKYRKKDPEGVLYLENEIFFEELKKSALEEAAGFNADQKFSRAKRFYDSITKFDPNDAGAWLLLGLTQIEMRSMMEASMSFKQAGVVLHAIDVGAVNAQDRKTLMWGGIDYGQYLINEGQKDSARTTLDLLAPALQGDNQFDALYRKVQ